MAEPSLEDFFQQVRTQNPFLVNRVDRPLSESAPDVFGIHEAEFRRLLDLCRQAHREHRGIGVTLWGEPGIGKTHLLARLGRWARERQQAQFVYLHSLPADPQHMPARLLHCVLGTLTQGRQSPQHQTPLFALLNAVLREARTDVDGRGNWEQLRLAYERTVAAIGGRDASQGVVFNPTVFGVLFRYYQSAYPAQRGKGDYTADVALRWLCGETLTAADCACFGLGSPDDDGAQAPGREPHHALQVFFALTELAACAGQQFILCLDQVDNLEPQSVRELARFVHQLLDNTGNLLLVTAGVRDILTAFVKKGVIPESTWDRVGQAVITPGRISAGRGRELLWCRLREFMSPYRKLPEVQKLLSVDPLFPLDSRVFEERIGVLPDLRARDLLAWAARRWREHQEALTTTPGSIWLARQRAGRDAVQTGPSEHKVTVVDAKAETQVERGTAPLPAPELAPHEESTTPR